MRVNPFVIIGLTLGLLIKGIIILAIGLFLHDLIKFRKGGGKHVRR